MLVARPGPVVLRSIRNLADWCEVLLLEGTSTFAGNPRIPLRGGWHDATGIPHPRLRVVTTDLGLRPGAGREEIQRNAALPLLVREPDDRVVLLLDGDELLDRDETLGLLRELDGPARIGLRPLFGAVDRVARSIHCCVDPERDPLRNLAADRAKPYVFAGPLAARARDVRGRSIGRLRFRVPLIRPGAVAGHHLTMMGPGTADATKLLNSWHDWVPRAREPEHLDATLAAGVHPAGWWIAGYREPEPWLVDLAREAGMRVAGPQLPETHLRALRAWAEARLDPSLPDVVVRSIDASVRRRDPSTLDLLRELDLGQLGRPMRHRGHSPVGDSRR